MTDEDVKRLAAEVHATLNLPVKVKFKKLDPSAVIPKYAKEGDAGLDLTATSRTDSIDYVEYGTGLAVEIPPGHVGLIFPRSSVSNQHQILTNCVGVIDSGYRGEIKFRFKEIARFISGAFKFYQVGDRIGQLVVLPYPTVELEETQELSNSERGEGGYGSTNDRP